MPGLSSNVEYAPEESAPNSTFIPIAIVGAGMRAPGGIHDMESLWDTLEQRKSHHACLYKDPRFLRRFDPEDLGFKAMFDVTPNARETLHGNLFDETPGLDESYFGISPRESACMDVQQKLLLHVTHEALEDAGYDGGTGLSFDRSKFGVYIGSATDDFSMDPHVYPIDIYHLPRTHKAFLAGQVSYHFGLQGPSVSVDTVCAGSITAIDSACHALASGECNAAIAGGVHVMTPISAPPTVMSLKLAGFLDPTGQCKPFLATGHGYCRAEGCGVIVLKRLDDAVRDGDRIRCIIRGIGVGTMSSAKSIMRPDSSLQSRIMTRALACSGLDTADVSFVEAHGPGTQAGDLAELESICAVLASKNVRSADNELVIGSVKGNIGHSEAASGTLSLLKVLAMMRYQSIPAQSNFDTSNLNPNLSSFFKNHAIRIAERHEAWDTIRKIAVVNNFGASGFAGSIVVEAPPSRIRSSPSSTRHEITRPVLISAKDPLALSDFRRLYAEWLRSTGASVVLRDISFSTTARRIVHKHSVLVHADSHEDLAKQLLDNELHVIEGVWKHPRSIAFCYSGQGGTGLDPRQSTLYGISVAFTRAVDECFGLSEAEQLVAAEDTHLLELFALQHGLSVMWTTWGLAPSAVAGHSFGEYAALVYAGVLSLRDALSLVGLRAALVREMCLDMDSRMAALRLPLTDVKELLRRQVTQVELACVNAEDRVTLAGTPQDLDILHEDLQRLHPSAQWQLVETMKVAFHSRFVEPVLDKFRRACEHIEFHPSTVTLLSGVLGRVCIPGDEALACSDYLIRHCRNTIQFSQAIHHYQSAAQANGTAMPDWIELGPHSTTIGFIPLDPVQLKVPSQRRNADGWWTVVQSLVYLRHAGHSVDFTAFQQDTAPEAVLVDLPRYPFRLQPHKYRVRRATVDAPSPFAKVTSIRSESIAPMLRSHIVAGQPICPAAVYMALAMSAAVQGRKAAHSFVVSRLSMCAPFTSLKNDILEAHVSTSGEFRSSVEIRSKESQIHATMLIETQDDVKLLSNLALLGPLIWKSQAIKNMPNVNVLDSRLAYALFGQTVSYGEHCQGVERVWLTEDGCQAWAVSSNEPSEVAARRHLEPTQLHDFSPILLDRAFQLVGFLINTSPIRGSQDIFMASEIDHMEFSLDKLSSSPTLYSYASFKLVVEGSSSIAVGQVYTFDSNKKLVASFRGVRMRKMKQSVVEHLVRKMAGAPPSEVYAPPVPSVPHLQAVPANQRVRIGSDEVDMEKIRENVMAIFNTTLCLKDINVDRKLCDLGLDSLTAVEIGIEVDRLLPGHKLDTGLLLQEATTLQTVFDSLFIDGTTVSSITGESPTNRNVNHILETIGSNPELIRDEPGTLPLLLIHDGSGTALAYRFLDNIDRTLLGIHSPGLHKGEGIVCIRDAANDYASIIRQWLAKQPDRHVNKILIGGWSLGGIISIALAACHPDVVAGILLIDSPPPGIAAMTADEVRRLIPGHTSHYDVDFKKLIHSQMALNSRALDRDQGWLYGEQSIAAGIRAPIFLINASESINNMKFSAEHPAPTAGSCSEWMLSSQRVQTAENSWRSLVGQRVIGTIVTPGDHFTMFMPSHSASTTEAIRKGAHALEEGFSKCNSN